MEVFVLTVMRYNVLDLLEVFESYQDAVNYANKFCDILKIPSEHRNLTYSSHMRGWFICDYDNCFISLQKRKVSTLLENDHTISNVQIFPDVKTIFSYQDLSSLVSGEKVTTPSNLADDYRDSFLPGGFSTANKPLKMSDIAYDPFSVKSVSALTDAQKWALVTARINKRPNYKFHAVAYSPIIVNQKYALESLKDKSVIGQQIKENELNLLQDMYDEYQDQDTDYYEDSSSSSSFE